MSFTFFPRILLVWTSNQAWMCKLLICKSNPGQIKGKKTTDKVISFYVSSESQFDLNHFIVSFYRDPWKAKKSRNNEQQRLSLCLYKSVSSSFFDPFCYSVSLIN